MESDNLWEQELERVNINDSIFKETLPDNYEKILQTLFYKIIRIIKDQLCFLLRFLEFYL